MKKEIIRIKKLIFVFHFLLIVLFLSSFTCGQDKLIQPMNIDPKMIARSLDFVGQVVGGAMWKDVNGENLFFVSQTGKIYNGDRCITGECYNAEIYAYCYVRKGKNYSLLWKTVDFENNCPFDLYVGLVDSSIFITDIDSNGVAECTYIYIKSCRSDVSPACLKLIMHEGKNKYAIRGTTKPDSTSDVGGDFEVDKSFNHTKPSIRKYAIMRFKEYINRDTFRQF